MLAFDAKEFTRSKWVDVEGGDSRKKETRFHTPLGAGVQIKDEDASAFRHACLKTVHALAESFRLPTRRLLYQSSTLRQEVDLKYAIPFYDQLVTKLQRYIELIHISYVILPPATIPTVSVGGYRSPAKDIPTPVFIRNLCPMFPHLALWVYFGMHAENVENIQLDGFSSKQTQAWSDVLNRATPKIYPRGDECNPQIMMADTIAALTDAKLYSNRLFLNPDNIQKVWEDYPFQTEVRFLDDKVLSKYRWVSDNQIDFSQFLAHPMIFLVVEQLEKIPTAAPAAFVDGEGSATSTLQSGKGKFREAFQKMDSYFATMTYACYKQGSAQFFDVLTDSAKVQDGDTMVYVGESSRRIAEAQADMHDIEVIQAKELKKRAFEMQNELLQ